MCGATPLLHSSKAEQGASRSLPLVICLRAAADRACFSLVPRAQ
jgi:hypothetical protein